MATYWVSDATGNDGDDGSTFLLAKQTVAAGLALVASSGDVLNIVNDGTYAWPTTETNMDDIPGTDYTSDPGYIIQGTDTAGDPAMATIAASGGDAIRRFIMHRGTSSYATVQNLIFDATGKPTDASIYTVARFFENSQETLRVRYCALLGGATGVMPSGERQLYSLFSTASNTDQGGIEYCYIQNCRKFMVGGFGGSVLKVFLRHVVYINDTGTTRTGAILGQDLFSSDNGNDVDCVFNTIYDDIGNNASVDVFDYQLNGTTVRGNYDCNSNLIWIESTKAGSAIGFILGGIVTSTATSVRLTRNYNVMAFGPSVVAGDLIGNLYQIPWEEGGTYEENINDIVTFELADTALFADPAVTYAWELPNGLFITILKDLRPKIYTDAGISGAVPGALPVASTVFTPTIDYNVAVAAIGDTVTLTVGISNAGLDATDVDVTIALDAGLTYVSDAPTAGTYTSGTGIWTLPTLLDSGSESLVITFTVSGPAGGGNIDATATVTSSDPVDLSPAMASDGLAVITPPMENSPTFDAAPFYRDVFKITYDTTLKLYDKRNFIDMRDILDQVPVRQEFGEYTARSINIGPTLTASIGFIGVAAGEFLLLDSALPVDVTIDGKVWTDVLALATHGPYASLSITNNDATDTATVYLAIVD